MSGDHHSPSRGLRVELALHQLLDAPVDERARHPHQGRDLGHLKRVFWNSPIFWPKAWRSFT